MFCIYLFDCSGRKCEMYDGDGSRGAVSSGGEFQTARREFVLIFVLHVSCVFFFNDTATTEIYTE